MSENLPARPTTAARVAFIVAALVLPCAICGGGWFTWFLGQIAIASASAAVLAGADKVGLIVQAIVVIAVSATFYAFSQNVFRPIYQGWLLAGLFTLVALVLRFLGPNRDQTGAIFQITLGLGAAGLAFWVRRPPIVFNPRLVAAALAVVPLIIWPFLLWGALGSGADVFLNLSAGLTFGLLAATLISPTAGNILLDGLGAGALLAVLGSAFGYDGGQLLLLAILPPFGFVVAVLAPSLPAAALGIGLLASTPLIFVDPTELSILLGDLAPWAIRASAVVILLELAGGAALWGLRRWRNRPGGVAVPAAAAGAAWVAALFLFVVFGQKGLHGDRIFVILKDQADVSNAYTIKNVGDRRRFVYQTLTAKAGATQAGIRGALDGLGIHYKPYYLVNALEVEGGTLVRLLLASRPEVDRILDSPQLRPLPQPAPLGLASAAQVQQNPGWDISLIRADQVWTELGVTGQGVIVGQSDTGVDGGHPALHSSYRGLTGSGDYNWYDPWTGTAVPTDQQGHGTHTLGSVLGGGGIGVAPGAQWIACVNLARNLGNPAVYLDCLQFMLAPFPQNGDPLTEGDPFRAADVLNNSWGCPPIEGCDPNVLKPAADALRAAGIFVVVSAGNDGPRCRTVNSPLALYASVFSVGAVDRRGNLAEFSSRGPVTVDGTNDRKPDIAAPGVDVLSAWPGGGYAEESGTSMAGPHVVGVVALLWSAAPDLLGDVDRTTQILERTAQPYSGRVLQPGGCDDLPLPNNGVGYGIVDAYAAVKLALGK